MAIKFLSAIDHGAYQLPTVDGSNGQVLTTDGNGNVTFQSVSSSANYYLSGASFNTGNGVLTLTVSGATDQTVDLDGRYALSSHSHNYDNYGSWNLKTNGTQRTTVQSGGDLNLVAGSNVSLSYSAGGTVTITSTDTNTDTNNYVSSVSFNTGNGILTLNRSGLSSLTVDLDGKYLTKTWQGGDDYFAGHHAEGRLLANAYLSNDLANARKRGSTFTLTNTSFSNTEIDRMFDGLSTFAGIPTTDFANGPVVIEFDIPRTLTYGAYVGIGFGNSTWRCLDVKIEAYSQGQWVTCTHETNNSYEDVYTNIPGNSGIGTTAFRITLDNPNNNVRICHIWAYNYNSELWSQAIMPRSGGSMYGDLSLSGSLTAVGYNNSNWDTAYGWGDHSTQGYITGYTETDTLETVTSRGNTTSGSINVHGNILLTGPVTTTNQGRMIDFTGFDKEGTTDFSDRAYIQHTTNTGGHSGSVLVISSMNDSGDGIAFLTQASSKLKHNSNNIATEAWVQAQGYVTSDTNDIDYINAASFNTSNGVITGTGIGNAGFTVDIDGRYLLRTTDTFTGALSINGYIKGNGQELILSAGESHSYATGQTNEFVYINAESGLQINSSPDNWASGWAGRKTTTINDTSGNSTFAGALFWSGGGSAESNAAYDNMITAAAVAGGANKTLTLTQQDGGTITATWTDTDTNDVDYISSASFANGVLTLSGVGNAGASVQLDGRYQLAGTYNTVIGTDSDINTSGATIIDNIYVTDGVITSMGTRTLTPGDIGAAYYDHFRSLGTQAFTAGGGSNNTITTTQLISEMEGDGAFDSYTSAFKTSWSYAGNDNLSDAGNFTETAGSSWLTWTDNSNDSTRGNITALAIAPNTGGSAGRVFIYNDQGSTYDPGWREVWTNMSLDPIINATVSNDTITFTKANGSTFNISTSDANTNYYLDGLSFNTGNGILTASVNGTTNQTVDLDGRYQLAGTYNTIIGTDSDINTSGATVIDQLNMTDGVITSHSTRTLTAANLGITQPDPPTLNALNIVGETIEVVFDQSPTPDIDKYEVWSSVSGGSYGLIASIPTDDIAPVMTAIDAAFSVSGTQAYRVYAIKNGIYSVAATGSTTFNTPSLSVVNMSVINLNPAYYIQYDLPDSRFIDHIEIYMDAETTSSSLSRTGASLIYSGSNSSYMYQIGASDLDKFHQFWVEVVAS